VWGGLQFLSNEVREKVVTIFIERSERKSGDNFYCRDVCREHQKFIRLKRYDEDVLYL
jgi:hypothetical protein